MFLQLSACRFAVCAWELMSSWVKGRGEDAREGGSEGGRRWGPLLSFLGGGQSEAKQVTVLDAPLTVSLVYCTFVCVCVWVWLLTHTCLNALTCVQLSSLTHRHPHMVDKAMMPVKTVHPARVASTWSTSCLMTGLIPYPTMEPAHQ